MVGPVYGKDVMAGPMTAIKLMKAFRSYALFMPEARRLHSVEAFGESDKDSATFA